MIWTDTQAECSVCGQLWIMDRGWTAVPKGFSAPPVEDTTDDPYERFRRAYG